MTLPVLVGTTLAFLGCGPKQAARSTSCDEPSASVQDAGTRHPPDGGGRSYLEPRVIQSLVRTHYDTFRRCYEAGLRRDPNLHGRVTVRFVIERDGKIGTVRLAGNELGDDNVTDCIMAEYRRIQFPPPVGGIVTVEYPIMFSPGDPQQDADAQRHEPPRSP